LHSTFIWDKDKGDGNQQFGIINLPQEKLFFLKALSIDTKTGQA